MIFLLQIMLMALCQSSTHAQQILEVQMKGHLDAYEYEAKPLCTAQVQANWDVATDVSNATKKEIQKEKVNAYANFRLQRYNSYWKEANVSLYIDPDVKRKLSFLKNIGTAAFDEATLNNFTDTKNRMTTVYNTAKICPFDNQMCDLESGVGLALDPGIETLLSKSTNYNEQLYLWEQWRLASGKEMRDDYKIYVDLMNQAAKANEFKDAGEMWRSRYEDPALVEKVDKLWSEVKPLYDELHTYVRYKLLEIYPDHLDKSDPSIPAHLFGNMWAQNWVHLYDRTKPFNGSSFDVTPKIAEMNVTEMFKRSDEFYQSLGLPPSEMSYGPKAMIERPANGTEVQCHASAWDFCDGEDFRIKQCTKKTMEDFIVVHHEMGHIMYYLLYKNQSLLYRGGANPGFHEAVGDTIALSVSTPKHLKTVGLLTDYEDSHENDINSLYHMALERVAFLPFGLLIDKWRWDLFSGATLETEWNKHWWELREKYQKVRAPTPRGEEFFDPGAKFHIPADSQYIAYFVAHILQFSFYKSLCIAAGEYDPNNSTLNPLHKCDYFNNKDAGTKLARGLELGMSEHWSVALNELTGSTEISASALLEYFEPLHKFLKEENKKKRIEEMPDMLAKYEVEGSAMCNKMVKAEWGVATDTENDEAREILDAAILEGNKFNRDWFESTFKDANPDDFSDDLVKRQLKYLTKLGRDALDVADLTELTKTQADIEKIYNTAKICPFTKQDCNVTTEGLPLEPELYDILASSTNYDELEWVWTQWRDKSGKHMRTGYKKYIELNNKAAELNNFTDYGAYWRESYEDPNFIANIDKMWDDVKPLYDELHKYVRTKLKAIYGDKLDIEDDLIPAHVFGNMWAQSWINLYEKIKPFSGGSSIDITENMKTQNYTVERIFEMSNKFFMDLGLPNNSMSYQEPPAIINKPNRTITCHASAWDFCDGNDFRIKQCTSINQEDFVTVHHEMGHINYFILYKDQPLALRTGANPGFHEAVGDLIALSVSTPQHLKKVGLLTDYADSQDDNINALFKMALERVAFLPFGLLIDKWRWDVFSGSVNETEWNKRWWEYRTLYQKIKPPSGARSEEFFDPGAKYHIPADSQYIAYFVAHILEFQLHRAVCIEAGQYNKTDPAKPLHKCDIDESTEAGAKIRAGLQLGLSKHWSEALKAMTGETEIRGEAILDYFKPLYDYLKEENERNEEGGASMIVLNAFLLIGAIFVKYFL